MSNTGRFGEWVFEICREVPKLRGQPELPRVDAALESDLVRYILVQDLHDFGEELIPRENHRRLCWS